MSTAPSDPGTADPASSDPGMPDMPRDPERTRGRYAVTLDGRPAGMDERFVLGDIAPGVWRVRSTRITARPTSRLETDVRVDADGTVAVALRWVDAGGLVLSTRTATADGELEVRLVDLDGPWPEPLGWGSTT